MRGQIDQRLTPRTGVRFVVAKAPPNFASLTVADALGRPFSHAVLLVSGAQKFYLMWNCSRKCILAALHSPKPTGRRLTLAESREIFVAFQGGESVTSIARRLRVSRPTVYRAIEKHGRPGNPALDSARVTIRLTPEELAALDVLSGRMGLSRSALGRRVLRLAAGFLEPDPEMVEAMTDLSRQVKAVGGNLNQIAAHLNREALLQGRASPNKDQQAQIEASERALKALAKDVDRLFVHAAKRRKARVDAILRKGDGA